MSDLRQIKEVIQEVLDKEAVQLYDLSWQQEGKNRILQVAIMREDGSMDIELCALVSEQISEVLDRHDLISFEYFLEICSPGAERELLNEEQIMKAIDDYVFVKMKDPKKGMDSVTGYLRKYDEEGASIEYMEKTAKRSIVISKDNIAMIRLSVKL